MLSAKAVLKCAAFWAVVCVFISLTSPSYAGGGGKYLDGHPRLLFSADDVSAWRSAGNLSQKFIWDANEKYFDSCRNYNIEGQPWNSGDGWQKYGWWWGTTAAFAYAKTGDQQYGQTAVKLMLAMCDSEHWELGGERDYGMGAANIMATVAIIYDSCYDLLSDEQCEIVRKRLLLAARRFHEYGFNQIKVLDKPAPRYWQADPQNNHRWHRLCGYLLGTLAIAGEIDGVDEYLDEAINEAEFILKWLPQDGSCHESVSYHAFGTQFIVPATVALDRNTGSNHLTTNRAFREFPHFRTHMVTPDRKHVWSFGDGGESTYYFNHYNFKLASAWGDSFMQAAHMANFKAAPSSYIYPGFALIWHDPYMESADLADYPTWRFFPDMGIATFRGSWSDSDSLACFFKCGPYGGHRLNEYRDSRTPPLYVNVAHDHPDANSFLVSFKGELLAADFGTHARVSSEHNTITVNGKSQAGSGLDWCQPIENMGKSARVEQYFGSRGCSMVRGEAGNFYEDLSRYARTLIYVDDAYLLVADDIRSPEPADIQWYYNAQASIPAGMQEILPIAGGRHWQVRRFNSSVYVAMVGPNNTEWRVENADNDGSHLEKFEKAAIVATSKAQRRAGMLTFVSGLSDNTARLTSANIDGLDRYAIITRGDLKDIIIVSADMDIAEYSGVRSDGETVVVTVDSNDVLKSVTVAGASFVEFGDFKLSFSQDVCARFDVAAKALTVNAPLDGEAFDGSVSVAGADLKRVNGDIVCSGEPGSYNIHVPTWQQRQDDEDGYNDLPVVRQGP